MASPYKHAAPTHCRVCGRVIIRRPGMSPSAYLKLKYHVEDHACAKEYRHQMALKAGETRRRNRAEKKAKEDPQFMIMPVILDRSTNY